MLLGISVMSIGVFSDRFTPALGQPGLIAQAQILPITPNARIFRNGSLEYAYVELDGVQLFPLAAPSGDDPSESLAQQRVQTVERKLNQFLSEGIHSTPLEVVAAELNSQTVVLATDRTQSLKQVILTVTELDAQLAQQSIPELAQQWAETLQTALAEAQQERQPTARATQRRQAIRVAILLPFLSLGLFFLQERLQRKLAQFDHLSDLALATASTSEEDLSQDVEHHQRRSKAQLHWQQQRGLYLTLRRLLQLAQGGIWLGGVSWILYQFPETRDRSFWLVGFPIQILIILIVMFCVAQVVRFVINKNLQAWVNRASLMNRESQRIVLRAPTLEEVLGGLINLFACLIGIVWFLAWHQVSFEALTSAGLVGVALSFVFQNLLKDWVNGLLIIFEDQYAVGDVVEVGNAKGTVEHMSLRSTQLRGENGSVVTVPHNQAGIVRNFTKDWSRIDFVIEVAYNTDINLAMQVMKEVIESMYQNSEWQDDILEPTRSIGVNNLSASGVELLMQIKTKRSRQARVKREFLRQLKLAFDAQEIKLA
ncbi:MAG: mechanosensitive ion channel family protein [Elainellaceae cyanobacterium]